MSNRIDGLISYYDVRIRRTVLFTASCNTRTSLIEEQKAFGAMAKMGQWFIKNVRDVFFRATQLSASEDEYAPTEVSTQSKQ